MQRINLKKEMLGKLLVVLPLVCCLSGCVKGETAENLSSREAGNRLSTVTSSDGGNISKENKTLNASETAKENENTNTILVRTALDDWLGKYTWYEHWGPDESVSVDVLLYQAGDEYYAYVEENGYDGPARITAQVKLEKNEVCFYFIESTMPVFYQEGQLLFVFKQTEDGLHVKWCAMEPTSYGMNEEGESTKLIQIGSFFEFGCLWNDHHVITSSVQKAYLNSGRGRIDPTWWSCEPGYYEELQEKYAAGEEEQIHIQDYDADGRLHLNFYYDPTLCRGVGVSGLLEGEASEEIYGFKLRGYKRLKWQDERFFIPESRQLKQLSYITNYEETWEYNDAERPVSFLARGNDKLSDKNDGITLISANFTYRPDGTLKEKIYMGAYVMYVKCQYDINERLIFKTVDVNHGARQYFYVYEDEESRVPRWCLMLDLGWDADFFRFVE